MNFLFDNPLVNMSGPFYLVFYASAIACLSIVFVVLKKRLDYSDRLPLPPVPSDPDPFEIALLRGGENELARAVVFSLTRKEFVHVNANDSNARIEPRADRAADPRGLSPIEQTAFGWLSVSREPKEIFDRQSGLTRVLEPYRREYESRLEKNQMLASASLAGKLKPFKYLFVAAILTLGAYRFAAALLAGRTNVVGLIFVAGIGLLIFSVAARLPRLTKLGRAYLERLRLAFDNLKTEAQKPFVPVAGEKTTTRVSAGSIDPILLSVGVFGSAVLAGTIYDEYNRVFQKSQAVAGSDSGCGSSGDSSGSDGCGSCGSGCGGCGGD